jgi:hypothetical protein
MAANTNISKLAQEMVYDRRDEPVHLTKPHLPPIWPLHGVISNLGLGPVFTA